MTLKRKIFLGLAALIALSFLILAETSSRKKSTLEAYRAELKARGEKLTPAEIAPHFSADEESAARNLNSAFSRLGSGSSAPLAKVLVPGHALAAWKEQVLASEDSSNIWESLRSDMAVHSEALATIREASQEPLGGLNLDYSMGFNLPLMHLMEIKRGALMLTTATALELHNGHPAEAWENLIAAARILRVCEREPTLISQLVRIAMVQITANATWEALQYPDWNDAQLAELQQAWTSFDLVQAEQSAFAMERAMQHSAFELMRSNYTNTVAFAVGQTPANFDLGEFLSNRREGYSNLLNRYPRYWAWQSRWSYDEEVYSMKLMQAGLEVARQFQSNTAFISATNEMRTTLVRLDNLYQPARDKFLLDMGSGWIQLELHKFGATEMQRRIVITAIALRRFQLAHQKYPGGLKELVPTYLPALPLDSMDGKPLRYKPKPDGTFLLYSVGDDGIDDGGDPTPTKSSTSGYIPWIAGRDAVWPMPATREEIDAYKEKMLAEWKRKHIEIPKLGVPVGQSSQTN